MSLNNYSVIIPVAKEESNFNLLKSLKEKFSNFEIILVVDKDQVLSEEQLNDINSYTNKIIKIDQSTRGKALNAGAEQAQYNYLWFLHLDSDISKIETSDFDRLKKNTIGYFKLSFDQRLSVNAIGANLRSKILNLPFGDQSFLMSKNLFQLIGKFDENLNEGEDHKFIWSAKALGVEILEITREIITSPRKYEENAIVQTSKTIFKTIQQIFKFKKERIENIICFFVKDPFSQNSKTRLRKVLQNDDLVNNFSKHCLQIIRETIDGIKSEKNKIVLINNSSTQKYLEDLELNKFSCIPLTEGELGENMQTIYDLCSNFSDNIIFVGSDIPQIESKHILQTIKALKSYDNFIIPTKDGGFCCFGTKLKTLSGIFKKTIYSTSNTFYNFTKSLYNLKKADYKLIDVDTVQQLREAYQELKMYKDATVEQKNLIQYVDKHKYS